MTEQAMNDSVREIYLAGGCFWGTEHFLRQIRGVVETEVGYANGNTPDPTYEIVCGDKSGYAETVRVVYSTAPASTTATPPMSRWWPLHWTSSARSTASR